MDDIVVTSMSYQEAIELLREETGKQRLSQKELAERSGLSTAQVSRIFAYKSTASTEALTAMARTLKYPEEALLKLAGILRKDARYNPWVEHMAGKLELLAPELRGLAEDLIDRLAGGKKREALPDRETKPKPRSA